MYNIATLHMFGQALTDAVLSALVRACPRIRTLLLQDCGQLTDAGIVSLTGLCNLQHLNLQYCNGVTAAGLHALAGLPQLTYINVHGCRVSVGEADACGFRGVELMVEKPCWWKNLSR